MSPSSTANKFDGGKLPMHLLPPEFEQAMAELLGNGAKKYGDRNWEQGGLSWDRLYSATRRHLAEAHKFMSTNGAHGEWIDPEFGLPHIVHAAFGLLVSMTYVKRGQMEVPAKQAKLEVGEYIVYRGELPKEVK